MPGSFPQYQGSTKNMPEVHSILGRFSAIAVPVVMAGKGFTVARQGTGAWNINLPRAIPTGRLLNVQVTTGVGSNEDIVVKYQIIASTQIRVLSYTAATPTDPAVTTEISFRIDYMTKRLPVV